MCVSCFSSVSLIVHICLVDIHLTFKIYCDRPRGESDIQYSTESEDRQGVQS